MVFRAGRHGHDLRLERTGGGMTTNAGHEIVPGRQLDQVVVCPSGQGSSAGDRIVVSREHDDWRTGGLGIRSKHPDERQAVDVREDEILKDDSRTDRVRPNDRVDPVAAAVKFDVLFARQQAIERHGNELLIVHQQHGNCPASANT